MFVLVLFHVEGEKQVGKKQNVCLFAGPFVFLIKLYLSCSHLHLLTKLEHVCPSSFFLVSKATCILTCEVDFQPTII